jgi:uncharacterized protein (TIGR00661 family)
MGDSRGHISRALALTQELPHHEFLFLGQGKVQILKERGYQVEDIPTIFTIIRNNRVDFAATMANTLTCLAQVGPALKKTGAIIREFDPHLIISDFEFVTPKAARLMGRPCIGLGNLHLLTQCAYDPPPGQRLSRLITCSSIRWLFSGADRYLMPSFHALPPLNGGRAEVFPPLIKPNIRDYRPTAGDNVLVYLRGYHLENLIKLLKGRKRRYLIYGMGEKPSQGNLCFKKSSEEDFLADLASCDYVISNGGLSLISEALFLGKPVLCLPIEFLYEQFFNAHFLAQSGFGHYFPDNGDPEAILNAFEGHVDGYRARITKYDFFGNKQIAARLEELIRG